MSTNHLSPKTPVFRHLLQHRRLNQIRSICQRFAPRPLSGEVFQLLRGWRLSGPGKAGLPRYASLLLTRCGRRDTLEFSEYWLRLAICCDHGLGTRIVSFLCPHTISSFGLLGHSLLDQTRGRHALCFTGVLFTRHTGTCCTICLGCARRPQS